MGRKISARKIKRDNLFENKRKGAAGQRITQTKFEIQGYQMRRAPKGRDFVGKRYNILTGKVEEVHVESKTGKSRLSSLQKKTRKNLSGRYLIDRNDPIIY